MVSLKNSSRKLELKYGGIATHRGLCEAVLLFVCMCVCVCESLIQGMLILPYLFTILLLYLIMFFSPESFDFPNVLQVVLL